MKKTIFITFGVAITALVIKNTYDIYQFRGAATNIINHLNQQIYDREFVHIVERSLYDLDDNDTTGEN